MPDYLRTRDWKAVLKKSENRSVKKTGISGTLDDYESALKKNDTGKMVSALERLATTAEQVKKKYKDKASIVEFLEGAIKEARTRQQALTKALNVEDEENDENDLGKALGRVRQLSEDRAWHFVLVPGKPSPGFVISKKPIKKKNLNTAFEMRGKRGVFFVGRCFFESGKYILQLEDKPVPGLAKAAKRAAQLHAEVSIKVIVRGAGVELDDDTDMDAMDDGGSAPLLDEGRLEAFEAKIAQLAAAVDKFETSANAKKDGAADGISGAIRVIEGQIDADDLLEDGEKNALLAQLTDLRDRVDAAAAPAPANPAGKYPTLAQWEKLIEGIVRLDPSKRLDAQKKLLARLTQVRDMFRQDEDLVEPHRGEVRDVLREVMEKLRNAVEQRDALSEAGADDGNSELARRMQAIERRYDQMIKTPAVDQDRVAKVGQVFQILRKVFAAGDLDPTDNRIARVEELLENMAKQAFAHQQTDKRAEGHAQMHEALSTSVEFMRKAMVPTGVIKDQQAVRDAAARIPEIAGMLSAMRDATQNPSKDNGAAMEAAARDVLAKAQADADEDTAALAAQVLARGTMMRLVAEYEDLGDPPWDTAKADRASELQAELFFLEGAITQGQPNYEAPGLGSDSGASESWWIERQDVSTSGNPEGKKKYIFKPAELEATVLSGLTPGSGAPREVLAKRLDELMAGAGFDIGVSPTTLASIDAAHLGTIDPAKGPMMGSMQQLAPADGELADNIADFVTFSETIDKKNFDDVAVFDMLFANLDRHAKNMLYKTDPDTGKNYLVPIDHGSALPDPEALYASRSSIGAGVNIMAHGEMVPAQSPLGAETVEALMRMDADQMVADLKQANADMANRHEATEGMISDAAIDALGARIRFIQAAASEDIPVAKLFEMLAVGALEIAQTGPDDMAALVKQLDETVTKFTAAKADITAFASTVPEANGAPNRGRVRDVLLDLGWAGTTSKSDFGSWLEENPELAARIIKTNMENPALLNEIERLRPQALQNDPEIEAKAAGKKTIERYLLFVKASLADALQPPANNTPLDDLMQEFDRLGGMNALNAAFREFPVDVSRHMKDPAGSDDDIRYGWLDRVTCLRTWAAYQNEGGTTELLRRGGALPREGAIENVLLRLIENKSSSDAARDILAMDDDAILERSAEQYDSLLARFDELIATIRYNPYAEEFASERDLAAQQWEEGNATAAIGTLLASSGSARRWIDTEEKTVEKGAALKQKLRDQIGAMASPLKEQMEDAIVDIFEKLNGNIALGIVNAPSMAENEYNARLEIFEQGDDAPFNVESARLQACRARLPAHSEMPWFDALTESIQKIETRLEGFDVSAARGDNDRLEAAFDAVDLLSAAVGNVTLADAPDEVGEILGAWPKRIEWNSQIDKAQEDAQRIGDILANADANAV
jgi:hypothetical protein